jgi:hypothetical protein
MELQEFNLCRSMFVLSLKVAQLHGIDTETESVSDHRLNSWSFGKDHRFQKLYSLIDAKQLSLSTQYQPNNCTFKSAPDKCYVSEWTEWEPCSASCTVGGITPNRTRVRKVVVTGPTLQCPVLSETVNCDPVPPPCPPSCQVGFYSSNSW